MQTKIDKAASTIDLENQLNDIRNVLQERIDIEKSKEIQKYVGSYFKYKNSYSSPENENDYWWLYIYVKEIKNNDLIVVSFQTDKDGKIIVDPNDYWHHDDNYIECSQKEFDTQWNKMIKKLRKISSRV